MRFLRTNTATRITVGPFFDKTDGITPEVALTATNEKLTFTVDDAGAPTLILDTAATASGGSNDMVHISGDDAGFYDLELAAANVNYLGRAMLAITFATDHCPVFHEFMILPAMIYDSLILGTDRLDTNVTHIGDTSQTARDIGLSVLLAVGTGTGQVNLSSGAVPVKGNIKKNTALATFPFLMTDSTNHNPATSKTITATRSIDGGAFGAGTLANAVEVANGIYTVDFGSGDLNGNVIILRVTATGCDDTFVRLPTYVA